MNPIERYKKVFIDSFEITESSLEDLKYQDIPQWDSLGHMSMIGALEDEFEIMFEMDDIIDFSSYKKGIETLTKYGIEF
ncbi:acyl carrier protein [Prochlorococcus marinus]|uniref:acyl carrier protein n=1 Tax=Prochlorococcus marinus TaxID=1219 RepID=UPI0022B54457|nr:acyl carrier protein [Prochlorococcus marinus]